MTPSISLMPSAPRLTVLLLALAACGTPSSTDSGAEPPRKPAPPKTEPTKAEDAKPSEPRPSEPKAEDAKPSEPEPEAPVLIVDAKAPETPKPLPEVPVVACNDASTTPLRCGLATVCKDLAERWVEQLGAGESAKADVAKLAYPEAPCPDSVLFAAQKEFSRNAIVLEHRLDVLVDDAVAELVTRGADGWRSQARITEVAATGMGSQKAYRPVASWERELDGDDGRELVVLVRGRDSGNAADADPFTRAYVVVCGGMGVDCRVLVIGEWLEADRVDLATPAQREQSWSGTLRFHLGRKPPLVLDAEGEGHDLETRFDELPKADGPLIPAPTRPRPGEPR